MPCKICNKLTYKYMKVLSNVNKLNLSWDNLGLRCKFHIKRDLDIVLAKRQCDTFNLCPKFGVPISSTDSVQ